VVDRYDYGYEQEKMYELTTDLSEISEQPQAQQ
jgi:hypothetical protein